MPLQKRVGDLTAVTGMTGADLVLVSQAGGARRASVQQLRDYLVSQGVNGPTGPPGQAGVGSTGPASTVTGPRGDTGPRGADGATGPQGAPGAASTVPGPTGIPGAASTVTGPAGPTGEASSVTGPTGNTGPASTVAGPRGDTGPSGAAGSNGTNGTNGSAGATGATGPRGSDGSAGSPGASVTGPTGPQGNAGSNGAAGAQGATGPGYQTTVTGVSLSGTGVYDPLVLSGSHDAYHLTLATGASIRSLSITGPTGQTILLLNVGTTGAATINHATGVNANARFFSPAAGNTILPQSGGSSVLHYDGNQWRIL
jgi:hypothetical protein